MIFDGGQALPSVLSSVTEIDKRYQGEPNQEKKYNSVVDKFFTLFHTRPISIYLTPVVDFGSRNTLIMTKSCNASA